MEVCESAISSSRSPLTIGSKGMTCWQRKTRLERKLLVFLCFTSLLTLAVLIAFALILTNFTAIDAPLKLCTTPDCLLSAQYAQQYMDTSVDPCDDFYQFSCGNWDKVHPEVDNNIFDELDGELFIKLRENLEYSKQADDPKAIKDVKDVYEACINMGVANIDGRAHVLQWISEFGGWPMITKNWNKSDFNLEDVLAKTAIESSDYLIQLGISPDEKNTSRNALYVAFFAGSLDADDLSSGENGSVVKHKYRRLIRNVTENLSNGTAVITDEEIDDLIEFEIVLANITKSEVDSESQEVYYNKMTISELSNMTNHAFDWLRYLNGVFKDVKNFTKDDVVIVTNPEQIAMFIRLKVTVDQRVLANYVMWKYWSDYSSHIGDSTSGQIEDFENKLSGKVRSSPRWENCLEIVNDLFVRAMGNLYVKNHMKNSTRLLVRDLVADLRVSLADVLAGNDWMDEETLQKAQKKAEAIIPFVGYPDEIFNESFVGEFHENFEPSPVHVVNIRSLYIQLSKSIITTIDEPADRTRWHFAISSTDAFYEPTQNLIEIPAGLMLPPFFAADNVRAMNYGALGSVIGHELTHAFDNLRSQYDELGNLVNWWSNTSREAYQLKSNCLRQQYSSYCLSQEIQSELNLTEQTCVNGSQTLGENIADNGGLKIALNAYESWISRNGEDLSLPGLTQFNTHQLFFIGFAQMWCESRSSRGLLNDISYDEHSPNKYRVLGSLSNSENFAAAFQCRTDSPMNPKLKCSFW